MSSNAIRAVAIGLGLLAIVLAFFGYRMSHRFAENAARAQQQTAQTTAAAPQFLVVIATRPLPANSAIEKDSVALAPVTVKPTEYFADVEDVIGRAPLTDLDAGQPVTPRFFKESNVIARNIPPGYRALSVKVDDVVGVGGFVRPGDTVDVLVYIKSATDAPTGEKTGDKGKTEDIATQARMLLKDVRILAYEDHLVEPPKGLAKDANKRAEQRRERTAVVAVPEDQVTRVILGASLGEVRLALHGSQSPSAPDAPQQAATGSGIGAASGEASFNALPLNEEAKAKARALAVEPPDQVITATELARLIKATPAAAKKQQQPAARPRIEIYRGSKLDTVYP